MKKQLLSIFALTTLMNVNAQDITTGLVFHLTGNETITTTVTSSDASAATGTVKFSENEIEGDASNASITHSEGVDGTANGSFNIGTGSYLEFQAADITNLPVGSVGTSNGVANPNGSDRTYASWIKGTDFDGNIFSYGHPSNDAAGQHVHLHLEDDGTTVKMGHWSHDWKWKELTSYGDGKWHHIAIKVYETSTGADLPEIELFIDGVSQGAKTQTDGARAFVMNTNITTAGYTALTVGMRNTLSKDYVGEIDDLRIYNRALTTADIQALHTSQGAILSVNNIKTINDFKVDYTNDILTVTSTVELEKLSIVSLTGASLKDIKANESIDVSELSSGLYIIVGKSKNGRSTTKFIKQ